MKPGWRPTYDLPESTTLILADRGSTELWDSRDSAPTTGPPVLLLHGWNIDAQTNYGFAFPHLAASHRVVMYDQQGHGNGPRHDGAFTLEAVAEDAVAVLDALDIEAAIIVGYSLGGAVAQTIANTHPQRCAGLVLSATSGRFAHTRKEAAEFFILARTARVLRRVPPSARSAAFSAILAVATKKYPDWIAEVVRKGDPISLLEAGASLGTFDSSDWSGISRIPSSFVVTANDVIVPKRRQVDLATRLDVGSLHSIASGHEVPILNDADFSAALADAIDEVIEEGRVAH